MSNNFFTLQSPDREGGGTSIENRILKHMRQIQSFLFQTRQKEVQIINFFMQNKANLKNAQMNVTAYNTKDYGNFRPFSRRKNKANQSQFKPNSGPILALFFPKLALFSTIKPNFQCKYVKIGNLKDYTVERNSLLIYKGLLWKNTRQIKRLL